MKKETDQLLRDLRRGGIEVTRTRRHWKIASPEGPVFIPCTPSDVRSLRNARALLKRKGVRLT